MAKRKGLSDRTRREMDKLRKRKKREESRNMLDDSVYETQRDIPLTDLNTTEAFDSNTPEQILIDPDNRK